MKIYQVRAPKGKLKYYDEHVHYTLDGTEHYVWRKVQSQINNFEEELNILTPLTFETSKCKFENLDNHHWLKTDFRLPVMSKTLVSKLLELHPLKHKTYPVVISDSKDQSNQNHDFLAFYLLESLDCVDWKQTELVEQGGQKYFDYQKAKYRDDINYPPIFKIKGMSINLTHYVSESNIDLLKKNGIDGFEFQEPVG
jgi:hypothetical protein